MAGGESECLRSHVATLLLDRRAILLDLAQVGFIDSSGLGTMVRALANTRQVRGDLKLCNVPEPVRKVMEMTRLSTVFDLHESEEKALVAFYQPSGSAQAPAATGGSILCLDSNVDVLAYLRELLRQAGFEVQTTDRMSDALLLMRVSRFDLLLLGPDKVASPASPQAFQNACNRIPVVQLGSDFSTSHAGEAGAALLELIRARLNPNPKAS